MPVARGLGKLTTTTDLWLKIQWGSNRTGLGLYDARFTPLSLSSLGSQLAASFAIRSIASEFSEQQGLRQIFPQSLFESASDRPGGGGLLLVFTLIPLQPYRQRVIVQQAGQRGV